MSPAAYLPGHKLGTQRAEHKMTGPMAQAQAVHQVQACQLVADAGWRVTVDQLPQGQQESPHWSLVALIPATNVSIDT